MSIYAKLAYHALRRALAAGAAASWLFGSSSAAAQTPFAVGLMSEMSGPYSENGENCQRGWRAASDVLAPGGQVAGRTVRFLYADSQGDAKTGVSEFRRLTEAEGAAAVITTRSQIGMAVNPLSKQAAIPLLGTVGHPGFIDENPYAFRFYPSVEAESAALAAKAQEMGLFRFALITSEDQWMLALSDSFSRRLRSGGGQVAGQWTILGNDADISSLVMRVKQQDAEALFLNLGISQSGIVLKRLHELGVRKQIFTQFWGASEEARQTAGPEAVEGEIFVEADLRKPFFLRTLRRLYGDERASAVTYSCYAALSMLLSVLRDHPGISSAESLYPALLQTEVIALPDGPLEVKRREAQYKLSCKTVHAGSIADLPPN